MPVVLFTGIGLSTVKKLKQVSMPHVDVTFAPQPVYQLTRVARSQANSAT